MGESIVQTPFVKNKMGDRVVSGPTLEVSVSFGKFDNDALSWEKWSSFSPNKYLEEVEKCSTPGSVAQKKAYFEAHYKRIAAKKMELMEQEKQQEEKKMEPLSPIAAESKSGDESESTQVSNGDFSSSNGERNAAEEQQTIIDLKNIDAVDESKEDITLDVKCDNLSVIKADEGTQFVGNDESKEDVSVDIECDSLLVTEAKEGTISGIDESKEDHSVDVECDSLSVTEVKEGTISGTDESKEDHSVDVECDSLLVTKTKEGELHKVEEQIPEKGCQDSVVETPQVENGAQKSTFKESKNPKANLRNAPRKLHATEDRVSAGTKKKPAAPVTKSSRISTPTSKPASTTKVISPSQPSTKKATSLSALKSSNTSSTQRKKVVPRSLVSPSPSSNKKLNSTSLQRSINSPMLQNKRVAPTSLQRSINSPMLENKGVAPTSLHMSLSLSSPNSTPSTTTAAAATTTMRKSLFMEKMGDKEIVRRAFRAFQNSFGQGKSAGDMTYGGQEQVLSKGTEQKISTSVTPQKESERSRKPSKKATNLKGQSGTRSASLSSGASKDAGAEKKKVSSIRASTGSRSDKSADKWKEEVTQAKIKRPGSNR